MEFDKVLKSRRSLKEFTGKNVNEGLISEIVNVAQYAPNSGNVQNWEFIVIKYPNSIKQIAGFCKRGKWIEKANFLIIVLNNKDEVIRYFKEKGSKWGVQNCAAACQNMLLKATSLGIGSCWVGDFDEKEIKKFLFIPENLEIESVLVFGYSKEKREFIRDDIRVKVSYNEYGKKDSTMFPLAQNLKLKKNKDRLSKVIRK